MTRVPIGWMVFSTVAAFGTILVAFAMTALGVKHDVVAALGSIVSIIGAATIIQHTREIIRLRRSPATSSGDHDSKVLLPIDAKAHDIIAQRSAARDARFTRDIYEILYCGLILTAAGEIIKYIVPLVFDFAFS